MDVVRIDPGDPAAARDWWQLLDEAARVDRPSEPPPCPVTTRAQVAVPFPGAKRTRWVALADGQVVGGAVLDLPLLDNTTTALVHVVARPSRRRGGVGRVLHAHLEQRARAGGRTRMLAETREPETGGSAGALFASAMGARRVSTEGQRRLDVGAVDPAAYDRLLARASAASTGYELHSWTGPTPAPLLAGAATLEERMSTDPPMGDLAWERQHYDAERLQAEDAVFDAWALRRYSTAALERTSGEVAGITHLNFEASWRRHARQGSTIVAPAHRGHRLGLRMKITNLRHALAHEPRLGTVWTWNAADNTPMVAVNDVMGFRVGGSMSEWQRDLEPAADPGAGVENSTRRAGSRG